MTVPRSRGRKKGISEPYKFNEVGSYHLSRHHLKKAARRERRLSRKARQTQSSRPRMSKEERDLARGYRLVTESLEWKQIMGAQCCVHPVHGSAFWRSSFKDPNGVKVWNTDVPADIEVSRWESIWPMATGVRPVSQKMGVVEIEE